MDQRIQALVDRLPELEEDEKRLRQEANTCAFPMLGDDGQARMEIANPGRLKEIREELADIAQERQTITGKLGRLRTLLGENFVVGWPDEGYHARQRHEYASRFFNKICCEGQRTTLTPLEAIEDPRFGPLRDQYEPTLKSYVDRLATAQSLTLAADAILTE